MADSIDIHYLGFFGDWFTYSCMKYLMSLQKTGGNQEKQLCLENQVFMDKPGHKIRMISF